MTKAYAALTYLALAALASTARAPAAAPVEPAARGGDDLVRYVRVELPGEKRILQLAEVWVVAAGENVAGAGTASQSSVHGDAGAARAIDGGTGGDFTAGSVCHTVEGPDAWWELDLGGERAIDQITLFNRTDCCGERLEGFRLVLLDGRRREVWDARGLAAPQPRFDVAPFGAAIVTPPPTLAERRALQPRIDAAIDRGVEFLRSTQQVDGSWGQHQNVHFGGQTALSLLTLVKAGVPLDDPAVVAALAFLRANGTESTYGTGCLLMALDFIGDEDSRAWAGELAQQLIATQGGMDAAGKHPGMWTYPLRPNTTVCLSNTQYAVLGLYAARRLGVDVPDRVFKRTLDDLPDYRGEVERVKGIGSDSRGAPTAGFQYRAEGGHGGTSGSMTTAALAVMHVCREALADDLPRRLAGELDDLAEAAWRWLDVHFAVDQNPGRQGSWHHYYLYGLERVGAFYERTTVGGRDWYWDGARYLVEQQKGPGDWGDQTNTCFAVLFLKRATASKSGPVRRTAEEVHVAEGQDAAVRWRGTGRTTATFWVTGFGQDLMARLGGEAALRVVDVTYRVDGREAARFPGDPERAWGPSERYATQLDLGALGQGRHEVVVAVRVVDPAPVEGGDGTLVLEGPALVVDVPAQVDVAALGTRPAARDNLLLGATVSSVTASSQNNDGQGPRNAVDGLAGTYWLCKKDEATPTLTIELERPVRAGRLVLTPANVEQRYRTAHDRASVVEVRVNRDRDLLRFELDAGNWGPLELELPPGKQVRRLELRVVERVKGDRWPGHVGFSEVALLPPRRD